MNSPRTNSRGLAARLQAVLPPNAVLHDTEDLRPYECDGLSAYRQLPMIVALPQNEEEVIEVLRICHASKIPVVARGAGTGLSGGALPHPEGVLLSLAKLKRRAAAIGRRTGAAAVRRLIRPSA